MDNLIIHIYAVLYVEVRHCSSVQCTTSCLHTKQSRVFFFTRLVSGYCDKSAKEKVEKMIDVDTKVAQKSSCSIMLSISRVVSQLIARAAPPPPPHVAYLRITQSLLLPCSSFLFDIIFSQQVQQQCIEQYINPQWGQSRIEFAFLFNLLGILKCRENIL